MAVHPDFIKDLQRASLENMWIRISQGVEKAGGDTSEIDLNIEPDGGATLTFPDRSRIALGIQGPDGYSESEYWMATEYHEDGSVDLIFDGSEDESELWTLLAKKINGEPIRCFL